jgi:hypothetical protein
MKLISSQGDSVQLGYNAQGSEILLNITFSLGFNLAVGSRGIQAVQCIMGSGSCHDGSGLRKRLPGHVAWLLVAG